MKTFVKIAVLLLALLMLVPCFAACKQNETTAPGGNGNNNNNNNNNNGGDGYVMPEVVDMGRYVYKAYVRMESGNASFFCEDFWVDPTTGGADAISFAVIERNQEIEQTYNCTIKQQDSTLSSQYQEMTTFFEGNTNFELAILVAVDAATCAASGMLVDLKNEESSKYINLSHEAFDQNSIDQMTLGNNLYYLSGDMNISSMDNTISTIFNVDKFNAASEGLIEDLGDEMYGDVYKMVENKTWTMENMLKMAKRLNVDANSTDGALSFDKGDTIGYFEYISSPLYYFYSSGCRIATNESGYPRFTITDDKSREVYEYIFNNFNTIKNPDIPYGASGNRAQNFLDGAVYFVDYLLWDVRTQLYTAESDVPYGILPTPLYEEGEDYHCVVYFQNTAHLWSIPYKRNSVENSSRMMYIMAAYSGKEDSTMDAYYIRTMYMEVARDDGSRYSLDIIRDALVYDIALLYSAQAAGDLWGNFDNLLTDIVKANSMQYDSYTDDAAMSKAEGDLQDTIDAFNKNS